MDRYLIPLLFVFTLATDAQQVSSDCQAAQHTMGDLQALRITVEAYYKDHNRYPEASSIEQLAPLASPVYIRDMPLKDGWGNAYLYRSFADGKAYILASPGSDGAFDESTWASKGPRWAKDDAIIRSGQQPKMWEGCK
ncbi:MAG TPA: type II secretion system protein GspG [Thermoanaerobaculia bacterium]|nr:type II secretion system protein GspG [Thermoanaerobaculia bacterium]